MTAPIGVIVGSGLDAFGASVEWASMLQTPYGDPSSAVGSARIGGLSVHVLARHGLAHSIAPDRVNYRANVWAMKTAGCRVLIGVNVVGAIAAQLEPGAIAIPEQLIDYTWGRASSFGDLGGGITHVDFTEPFDPELRGHLAMAAEAAGDRPIGGVYAVTQGPRLETAAEIDRLERDGCTMVGMTAMPEAALARELGMRYALVAVAVNFAAGRSPSATPIHEQLTAFLARGMSRVVGVLERALPAIASTL
jgi:5'-methylthioinosine phosphorylase